MLDILIEDCVSEIEKLDPFILNVLLAIVPPPPAQKEIDNIRLPQSEIRLESRSVITTKPDKRTLKRR